MPLTIIQPGTSWLYYYEMDGSGVHNQVLDVAWEAWDMSGFLPTGSMFADIRWSAVAGLRNVGVRQLGSALGRVSSVDAGGGAIMLPRVPIISGQIETFSETGWSFSCMGVWRY